MVSSGGLSSKGRREPETIVSNELRLIQSALEVSGGTKVHWSALCRSFFRSQTFASLACKELASSRFGRCA